MDAEGEEAFCCPGAYILGAEQDSHRVYATYRKRCYCNDGYHNVVSDIGESHVS